MESQGRGNISLSELCELESSPGSVFKLSPHDLSEYLLGLPNNYASYHQLLESAGEKIFTYDPLKINSEMLLTAVYGDEQ
jgi:hypothetical protein